jgi:hypothetical protein
MFTKRNEEKAVALYNGMINACDDVVELANTTGLRAQLIKKLQGQSSLSSQEVQDLIRIQNDLEKSVKSLYVAEEAAVRAINALADLIDS